MAKRIGRPPMKPPARGQRVSLGLKVTAEIKRHLDSAARVSGRTQSQEAEHLIEEGLQSRRMLEVMRTTLAESEEIYARLACPPPPGQMTIAAPFGDPAL